MALNPHFLQGSRGEQRLVQSLINEHLKIYGVEVTFIPRKFVNQSSIIEEVQASKFDDNFNNAGNRINYYSPHLLPISKPHSEVNLITSS